MQNKLLLSQYFSLPPSILLWSSSQVIRAGGLESKAEQVKVWVVPARRGTFFSVTDRWVGRKFMSKVIVFCMMDPL